MKRILVADDTEHCRLVLIELFRPLGCEVVAVDGGRPAQEKLEHESFDLVITDLRMAEGTGIELLRVLRRWRQEGKAVPPIIVTTALIDGGEGYLHALGVAEIFVKPVEFDPLLMAARRLLGL